MLQQFHDICNQTRNTTARMESTGEQSLFGKYELGKLLGRGAFAKVYHARAVETGQSVAIKAVSKQKLSTTRGGGMPAATVKREIAIMRRLRHPNVVKLLEVLATKTKIYFVMEFAKGGELFAKVAKGRFSEDLSRRYFRQLVSAVRYCHSRGVYHRDLKPENLLLDENWDLKVSDFGLSAVADQIPADGLLHTLCGTPAYVAPEILTKKGYDGAKVDVWTCGVVLFVLNAGYLPFNDPNLMAMYRKIYRGDFRFPKWTSPELRELISRLLDPSPETRITMDQILVQPWFVKGFVREEAPITSKFDSNNYDRSVGARLNAFDLISYSSGFNLSGLFDEGDASEERFVSAESGERVVERVGEVARGEGLDVVGRESEWWVRVEGEAGDRGGQNGDFVLAAEVHRLTEELVVVEVRVRGGGAVKIWRERLWPKLQELVFRSPDVPVTGE